MVPVPTGMRGMRQKRWMRRGSAVPAVIVLAGMLLAVQGCSSSSAATAAAKTTPALTIADARQGFTRVITADNIARASGDEWLEASVVAYGQVALATAAYQKADYLGQRVPRYRYGTPRLYVPRLKGFPHWFVAVVPRTPLSGGPTRTAIMVFDRATSDSDWTLNSQTLLAPGAPAPDIATDSSGYATPLATFDGKLAVSPDAVGALQATVAQDGTHSTANAAVAPGPYTTGVYSQIVSATKQAAAQGYHYQALLSGSSNPVFALQTVGGGALVIYTLNLNSVTLRSNLPVRQIEIPPAYAPLLDGKLVLQYELDTTDTDQYAAVIPPKASSGKAQPLVNVIAFDGGPTSAGGK
jgi:hypothetical protein